MTSIHFCRKINFQLCLVGCKVFIGFVLHSNQNLTSSFKYYRKISKTKSVLHVLLFCYVVSKKLGPFNLVTEQAYNRTIEFQHSSCKYVLFGLSRQKINIHDPQYVHQNSMLLVPVFCFAELVYTDTAWAKQHLDQLKVS